MVDQVRMRKILSIAWTEYRNVVLTVSFLLSLLLPLVLYGGMFAFGYFLGDKTDLRDRELLLVDRTGRLADQVIEANRQRNRSSDVMRDGKQSGPRFVIETYAGELPEDRELLIELSERVRGGELFAFAIIGPQLIDPDLGDGSYLHYFSDSPTFTRLPEWLSRTVEDAVEEIRFAERDIDRRMINQLVSHNRLERFTLAELDADGRIVEPKEENQLAVIFVPMGLVFLIFISIQMTTPVLLNSVIEEKMQRISEVLLSSVRPFQLLSGKLLAGAGVGLTFSAAYLLSLRLVLGYFEKAEWIPQGVFVWYFLFLLSGMLVFGSLFAALSSACQDLKDSQNFAGTIVVVLLIPFFMAIVMVESPDSPFATTMSLLPPFSVMIMMLRVAIPPGPPDWQIWLALALNAVFTVMVVWMAARIFRIGILSQGKTPGWRQIFRWVFRND